MGLRRFNFLPCFSCFSILGGGRTFEGGGLSGSDVVESCGGLGGARWLADGNRVGEIFSSSGIAADGGDIIG